MRNVSLAVLLVFFPFLTQPTVAETAHIPSATPISVDGVPNLYLVECLISIEVHSRPLRDFAPSHSRREFVR